MNSNEFSFDKTWRRLGLTQVWGIPLLIFAIVVVAFASLAFDAARLNNFTILWLPINTIAFLCGVLVVVIFWVFGNSNEIPDRKRPYFNLATAAVSMGVKNAVTLYLCEVFGVEDSGSYLIRFLGGAGIGVALLLIYSNILGARFEQNKIQDELLSKERYLLGFRENLGELFSEEEAELRRRTSEELIPRLTAIQESIQSSTNPTEVAKAVNKLLTEEVKPISKSLAQEATRLQLQAPNSTVSLTPEAKVALDFSKTIRPVASFICVLISWLSVAQVILRQASGLDITLASLTYLFTLYLIKFITRPWKNVSSNNILMLCWAPGFFASIPGYYLLYQVPHDASSNQLFPTLIVIGGCVSILFSQALIIERGRAIVEERLKEVVSKFSKENKQFEQRLWVAKRSWYTLLHGKVQSALTAAAMRLASKTEFTAAGRAAILDDLTRAAEALKDPKPEEVTIDQSLNAIRQTWQGIASITFSASEEIVKRINENLENSIMVNEILKESVSNAVKHGSASDVSIVLSIDELDNLVIKVTNNGDRPVAHRTDGVGSSIFGQLCLSTALEWNSSTKQTEFQAVLPIA